MDFVKIPSFNLRQSSVKITLLKPEQERREKQVEILRTSSVRSTRSDPQSSQGQPNTSHSWHSPRLSDFANKE